MVPSQSQAVGVMCQWGVTAGGKGVVPAREGDTPDMHLVINLPHYIAAVEGKTQSKLCSMLKSNRKSKHSTASHLRKRCIKSILHCFYIRLRHCTYLLSYISPQRFRE